MRVVGNQKLNLDEPLWRYFQPGRFLELLQTGKLYFASAVQFDDPFEGAVLVVPSGAVAAPPDPAAQRVANAFKELRRLTKVSCWHRANYESDAMWRLYASERKGVAIRTTPRRIQAAAKAFRLREDYAEEDIWAGNVYYVDLMKERLQVGMLDRFWYKHMAFDWEKEFRLAISLRMAEQFGAQVPELGVGVDFEISELVDRVYIGPMLSDKDIASIRSAAKTHGIEERIRVSSLLGTPRHI